MSCEGCQYWSEMVAEAVGDGPVKALCMHSRTIGWNYDRRMTHAGCEDRVEGAALDDPRLTASPSTPPRMLLKQ